MAVFCFYFISGPKSLIEAIISTSSHLSIPKARFFLVNLLALTEIGVNPAVLKMMNFRRRTASSQLFSKIGKRLYSAEPCVGRFFQPTYQFPIISPPEALRQAIGRISAGIEKLLNISILFIKRTWQPKLIKRKRKHGFLARMGDRHGRKILIRRKLKGRRRLCA